MASVKYTLDDDFENEKNRALARVHPARRRGLHLLIHFRSLPGAILNALSVANEYCSFLALSPIDLAFLVQEPRERAEYVCVRVAGHELVMGDRQMPHETATQLSRAWLSRFTDDAVFMVNAGCALPDGPSNSVGITLFNKDLEAGVIAVSSSRVGIFWAAEDS